jgi:hypothetical protein
VARSTQTYTPKPGTAGAVITADPAPDTRVGASCPDQTRFASTQASAGADPSGTRYTAALRSRPSAGTAAAAITRSLIGAPTAATGSAAEVTAGTTITCDASPNASTQE